jgi:hypothetical protein
MLAVRGEHPEIVAYLLKNGADKSLKNDDVIKPCLHKVIYC